MKELNCTRKLAFDAILRAAQALDWSISEVDESKKLTLESPTTLLANGQRYVFTILDENPCRLVYSLEGKKMGLLQAKPSKRLAELQIKQFYTMLDAEIESFASSKLNDEIGKSRASSDEPTSDMSPFAAHDNSERVGDSSVRSEAARKVAALQQEEKSRNRSLSLKLLAASLIIVVFIPVYRWATKPSACECVERFGKYSMGLFVSQSDFDECEDAYGWYNGSGQTNALHKCYEED